MKLRWFFGILTMLVLLPTLTFAAHRNVNTSVWNPSILAGPLVVCGAPLSLGSGGGVGPFSGGSFGTPNYYGCQNLCDLTAEIIQVLYFIIGVGIWILVPILFVWGGVMVMLARGNPTKASEARKMLTGAVWGVVIMVCAWLVVSTFVHFFGLSTYIPFFGNGGGACA